MNRDKNASIAIILMLALTSALIALPNANAQAWMPVMNIAGAVNDLAYILLVPGVEGVDIDLNGPTIPLDNVTLWVTYPGRAFESYIGGWATSGTDLDIYDFDFNETGDFLLRWRVPPQDGVPANPADPDGYWNSQVQTARVVTSLPATIIPSFVYVGASPNPVGVGQDTVIVSWTADMPPDTGETTGAVSSPTGRAGWYDMYVQIIKPDGTNETLNFPYSDPVGAVWISWTPTVAGNYTLQAYFPGAWKNSTSQAAWYEFDMSDPVELLVTEEPIQAWQEPPLPTDYWRRPINTGNRLWYPLAGNWLGGDSDRYPVGSGASGGGGFGVASSDSPTENFAYGMGCETPHVLWTKQYAVGGLMDERYDVTGYQTAHYQGLGFSGIILNGVIHYSPRITHAGTQGWAAVNLYTGEELWLDYDQNNPSFASIYNYESPNQHGGFAYLWRTSGVTLPDTVRVPFAEPVEPATRLPVRTRSSQTLDSSDVSTGTLWEMLDGFTGKTVCYIANVSTSGEGTYSKDGSILYYNIVDLQPGPGESRYLQIWNSSHGTMPSSQEGTGAWQWRPAGGTFGGANAYLGGTAYNYVHDGRDFFSLNVSCPNLQGPINARDNQTASIWAVREGEMVLVGVPGVNDEEGIAPGWMMAISLEDGQEGTKLWEGTWTPPSTAGRQQAATFGQSSSGFEGVYPEAGIFLYRHQRTQIYYAFSLDTFQQIWSSEPETQFGYYGTNLNVYNGILYSYGYGGVVYAYNCTTGELMWAYAATSEGFESTYGGNYPCGIVIISGDGKLYTVTGEHSPTQPLYRGHNLRCLNATTGDEIWKIQGWFGGMSPTSSNIMMADGILVGLNFFDNQIYAFGKGPSATTVTASPKTTVHGTDVVIEGTVTDQTPMGRRDIAGGLEFSLKGTPAISDEDMNNWMEYMFMQQAKPADAKGVEVVLTVIDPNNNVYEIGRTTSDVTGTFGHVFEPLVPGTYQVIATFAGSNAYGPSSASTYLTVEEAPAATAEPTPPPASVADMYFLPISAGIIIAIVVVGLLLFMMLRRR